MKIVRGIILFCLFASAQTIHAASSSSGWGVQTGLGLPFISQVGFHYKVGDTFGVALGYNLLEFTLGTSSTKLSMPEVLLHYHPFSGSFFIAAGVGQESLKITAPDSLTGTVVTLDVSATTTIVKTGWMWGISNGGFWMGVDTSYVMPSGGTPTITAPGVPETNQSYIDTLEAANKFSKTAFVNLTFLRVGWLF